MFLTNFIPFASRCLLQAIVDCSIPAGPPIILMRTFQQIGRIFTESITRNFAAAQRLFFDKQVPKPRSAAAFYLNKVSIWAEAQLFL